MNIEEKYRLLCAASRYDVEKTTLTGGQGSNSESPAGITYIQTTSGKTVSVLKLLFSNSCIYNCQYCPIRKNNDIPRTSFSVQEIVLVTMTLYRQHKIRGLFLSSGVIKDPDHTSQQLVHVAKQLRVKFGFKGYIHLKIIPGTSEEVIRVAGRYADRLSVNIELPSSESLQKLAPDKKPDAILKPMTILGREIINNRRERRSYPVLRPFSPAGHTTQLIIGATPEPDSQVMNLADKLYRKYRLARVYYSAYVPVNHLAGLPRTASPAVLREHRLYQADWLIREYGFTPSELFQSGRKFLDECMDPKTMWALENLDLFPVEVNRAERAFLIRIPGIGVQSTEKIIRYRRFHLLSREDLIQIGVLWEKARHFIIVKGKFYGQKDSGREKLAALFRNRSRIIHTHLPLLPGLKKNVERYIR